MYQQWALYWRRGLKPTVSKSARLIVRWLSNPSFHLFYRHDCRPFFSSTKALRRFAFGRSKALLCYLTTIDNPDAFYWVLLLYSLTYALMVLSLSSSVAFRHMAMAANSLLGIRVWGTLGWIAIGQLMDEAFHIAPEVWYHISNCGCCSCCFRGFQFLFPHTPPKEKGQPTSGVRF